MGYVDEQVTSSQLRTANPFSGCGLHSRFDIGLIIIGKIRLSASQAHRHSLSYTYSHACFQRACYDGQWEKKTARSKSSRLRIVVHAQARLHLLPYMFVPVGIDDQSGLGDSLCQ